MKRCLRCGWRWCECIPPGASVDWTTAIPERPQYGPYLPGRDPAMEILETIADIHALPNCERDPHLAKLVATYSAEALADALLMAHEIAL